MDSFIRVVYKGREVWMDLDSYLRECCEDLNRKQQGGTLQVRFPVAIENHLLPDLSEVIGEADEDD